MARTHRHKEEPVFLLQDTPDALREIGVDDEQEALAAVREPAQALEGASFLQAVGRFYRFYTLGRGHASRSEVLGIALFDTHHWRGTGVDGLSGHALRRPSHGVPDSGSLYAYDDAHARMDYCAYSAAFFASEQGAR